MNKHEEKALRMREHLSKHPHDYQSVISLFKTESNAIEYERKKKKAEGMALIAKYRREYYGKQSQQ